MSGMNNEGVRFDRNIHHMKIEFENMPTESRYINDTLKFFPPMYVQRYEAVSLLLRQLPWYDNIHKAVDFGCGELNFFLHLKHIPSVTEILEVDMDEDTLLRFATKAAPLNSDYLFSKRANPLMVYLLAGNITDYDDCLQGTDVLVAIEVLEHLTEDVLGKVPNNIFNNIKPRVAIFTTPNAEFNVLFPNFNTLRHPDHKFEWTRTEFYKWTQEIVNKYTDYTVKLYEVGVGPENTSHLGCCTQIAVFERKPDTENAEQTKEKLDVSPYKLIRDYLYPQYVDERTNEMKIFHEVEYRLKFNFHINHFYNFDEEVFEIPLRDIYPYVNEWCDSEVALSEVLIDHGFHVLEIDNVLYLSYRGVMSDHEINALHDTYEPLERFDLGEFMSENWDNQSERRNHSNLGKRKKAPETSEEDSNENAENAGLDSEADEVMDEDAQAPENVASGGMDLQSNEVMEEGSQAVENLENADMETQNVEVMDEDLQEVENMANGGIYLQSHEKMEEDNVGNGGMDLQGHEFMDEGLQALENADMDCRQGQEIMEED